MRKPLEFTPEVSPAAQDLLRKLLDRNPATRLQELDTFKAHPFFADINWTDLLARRIPAPFKPDANAVTTRTQLAAMNARREDVQSRSGQGRGLLSWHEPTAKT